MTANPQLIGTSDIARMAGVSRAVVGNWKRRHRGTFPQERGRSRQGPLYDPVEVATWLANRGRAGETSGAATEPTKVYWEAANHFRGEFTIHDIAAGLLYAVACQRADSVGRGEQFRSAVDALDDSVPAITARMREIAPTFLEDFLTRVSTDDASADMAITIATTPIARYEHGTPRPVAELIAHLVAEPELVLDPSIGTGSLVATVARRAGGAVRILGQDLHARSTAMAVCTTQACGFDADIRLGDSLVNDSFPDVLADTVVFAPPFGVRLSEPLDPDDVRWQYGDPGRFGDLAWVQTGLHHLAPGGTMVCLALPGLLFRSGRDRRMMQGLVRANRLRAVIALPSRVLESTTIAPVVLVLGSTPHTGSPAPAPILMVDAPTWLDHQPGTRQFDLTAATEIGDHVRAWLDSGELPDAQPGVALASFEDIVDNDWVLTPTRYQPRETAVVVSSDDVEARRNDADQQSRDLATQLEQFAAQPLPDITAATTSRALGTIRGVALLPGISPRGARPEPATASGDSPVMVSVRDLAVGETPREAPADSHGNQVADLDILITIGGHGIGATYFCAPSAPANAFPSQMTAIIRVDRDAEVTPDYLAAWLSHPEVQGELERLTVGTGLPRLRMESLQSFVIPIPDRDTQQRFADRWLQLRDLRNRQRRLASAIEQLDATEMSYLRAQIASGGEG